MHLPSNRYNWSLSEWLAKWDVTLSCQLITKWGERAGLGFIMSTTLVTLGRATALSCYKLQWSGNYIRFSHQRPDTRYGEMCTDFWPRGWTSLCPLADINNIQGAHLTAVVTHTFFGSFIFPTHLVLASPFNDEQIQTGTYNHTYGEFRVSSPPNSSVFGMLERKAHL